MSFHPGTGYVYIPVTESIYSYMPFKSFRFRPGLWNTGEDLDRLTGAVQDYSAARYLPCGLTRLVAWDPIRQEKAWEVLHETGVPGGTLATAGGLVFQGIGQGRFAAFDAQTGDRLWTSQVGIDVMAAPISYRIDGEQYISVLAGVGGSHGNHQSKFEHDNAGRVLTYKIGGRATMPAVRIRPKRSVSRPRLDVSSETIARGQKVYSEVCFSCHGIGLDASGLYPDLRTASAETHDQWNAIVRGGLRSSKGMPSFADAVSEEDASAIRAYVLDRAWHEPGILEKMLGVAVGRVCLPVSWATD
jgi:quinohemoprotein ethanol dehydrogenase